MALRIRRWHRACVDGSVGSDAPSPKRRRVQNKSPPGYNGDTVHISRETPDSGSATEPPYPFIPDTPSAIEGFPTQSPGNASQDPTAVQRMSTWDGAPSMEFQRQFLW
ncbi:hypothetical protein N7541_001578 [Penicillium brevicompactum]|uniref:Uncharacterized protein n=1 Tax=Penicillium brevicompactum TaxID=5074 RepID=A0A9W9RWM0_PENBR|nr:hypothetical protein N7541_001578 [Penicillium brevicompactum]